MGLSVFLNIRVLHQNGVMDDHRLCAGAAENNVRSVRTLMQRYAYLAPSLVLIIVFIFQRPDQDGDSRTGRR